VANTFITRGINDKPLICPYACDINVFAAEIEEGGGRIDVPPPAPAAASRSKAAKAVAPATDPSRAPLGGMAPAAKEDFTGTNSRLTISQTDE
jgi:hypothetical protein